VPRGRVSGRTRSLVAWRDGLDGERLPDAEQRIAFGPRACPGCGIVFLAVGPTSRCMACRTGAVPVRAGTEEGDGGEGVLVLARPLTHDNRAFEADIRAGASLEDLCATWGVTAEQVVKYCLNHNLPRPRLREAAREKPAAPGAPSPAAPAGDGRPETVQEGSAPTPAPETPAQPGPTPAAGGRRIVWYRPDHEPKSGAWVRVGEQRITISGEAMAWISGSERVRIGVDPDRREVLVVPDPEGLRAHRRRQRASAEVISRGAVALLREHGIPEGRLPARWDPDLGGVAAGPDPQRLRRDDAFLPI
jgi:hypothetical protein